MHHRLLRHSLIAALLLLLVAGCLQSCSKGTKLVPADPHIDTLGLLTAHRWNLHHFWFDMNNNERIDNGETIQGLNFKTVYYFNTNGTLQDSTVDYLDRTGTWSFKDNHMAAFYCRFTSTHMPTTDLHYIMSISDTTLITKRYGTNETWYFSKF